MAEQDIRENQMTEISSPAFIRCLDNAGNSGIIPLKGLFTDVMNYKRNIDGEDVDSVRETGIYLHGTGLDNGSAYGVLIVLNANIYFS